MVGFVSGSNAVTSHTLNLETRSQVLYASPGGSGDCLSWSTACDLQTAIAASSSGDQVLAAAGTYFPTVTDDRFISIIMKIGVAIYGGFPASGGPWDSRDWEANPTILSGDIGVIGDPSDNSYHVVKGSNVNSAAILDGFIITGGFADGTAPNNSGAGFYTYSGNPTLSNIAFIENMAQSKGGGIYSYESNPTLTNITLENNLAEYGGGLFNSKSDSTLNEVTFVNNAALMHGGGIYGIASEPSLTQVIFQDNSAGEHGGGLLNTDNCNPTLMDVTFVGNTAGRFGGGMSNFSSNPSSTRVVFDSNSAKSGGAIYNQYGSPILMDVNFSNNSASDYGGAIYGEYSNQTIENGDFTNNSAPHGGGIYNYRETQNLTKVIFSGNSVPGKGGGMYSYESSLIMNEVTFTDNFAGVLGGGMANYKLLNSTLSYGRFSGNTAVDYGGAIYNVDSSPVLSFLSISDNSARHGGGIYNYHSEPIINNTAFIGNSALQRGGGMYNYSSDPVANNLTFSNNSSQYAGGGLANYTNSIMTLVNATFYANTADVIGGGIYNAGAVLHLTNSIVWGNSPTALAGTGINAAYSDIQGGYSGTGNINADPLLGPLQDNGGFTLTYSLMPGSPAIDAGSLILCPSTDQRGFMRPADGDGDGVFICDMGAYEFSTVLPSSFIYLPLIAR